jgi:hypothetical protein
VSGRRRNTYDGVVARLVLEPETGCRIWPGTTNDKGYGRVTIHYEEWAVHVLVWTHHNGRPPRGMYVCHTCDVPACAEISHLWLGTHQENMDDMVRKGRQRSSLGQRNGASVLSDERVQRLRDIHVLRPQITGGQLAEIFGISAAQVSRILHGRSRIALGLPTR